MLNKCIRQYKRTLVVGWLFLFLLRTYVFKWSKKLLHEYFIASSNKRRKHKIVQCKVPERLIFYYTLRKAELCCSFSITVTRTWTYNIDLVLYVRVCPFQLLPIHHSERVWLERNKNRNGFSNVYLWLINNWWLVILN